VVNADNKRRFGVAVVIVFFVLIFSFLVVLIFSLLLVLGILVDIVLGGQAFIAGRLGESTPGVISTLDALLQLLVVVEFRETWPYRLPTSLSNELGPREYEHVPDGSLGWQD
jgi:hypothetical protein